MAGVGMIVVPAVVFWSRPSSWPAVILEETVFFFSTSPPFSMSPFSLALGCWERHEPERRLSKRAEFVNVLRHRRYILSRSSSDGTSGPSKSLTTMRKPPRGKRVILTTLVLYSTLAKLGSRGDVQKRQG